MVAAASRLDGRLLREGQEMGCDVGGIRLRRLNGRSISRAGKEGEEPRRSRAETGELREGDSQILIFEKLVR